ncbi:hypothetical protein N7501_004505 [Penicillium viridicatum]|nr:hypothetical protein N7501_004505 [Penicillium viridicatum]
MATRTVYLISARNTSFQRAHFSIFVPSATNPDRETKIHAAMFWSSNEITIPVSTLTTRPFQSAKSTRPTSLIPQMRLHPTTPPPRGNIELAATQIPTPRTNQDFMAPVNDVSNMILYGGIVISGLSSHSDFQTTNKWCQEWTMKYIRHLVAKGPIDEEAIEIVQSKRDSATHGIGLRSVIRLSMQYIDGEEKRCPSRLPTAPPASAPTANRHRMLFLAYIIYFDIR